MKAKPLVVIHALLAAVWVGSAISLFAVPLEPVPNQGLVLTAAVANNPAKITITIQPPGTDYTIKQTKIYRRLMGQPWSAQDLATLTNAPPTQPQHYDDSSSIQLGTRYEYKVVRDLRSAVAGALSTVYGLIAVGIDLPVVHDRGKVILIVDTRFTSSLRFQITQLETDLTADGWTVIRHDFEQTRPQSDPLYGTRVRDLRSLIQQDWNGGANGVKAVFLLGNLPIAYSGGFSPDGHPGRALPTDFIYAELNSPIEPTAAPNGSNWTDSQDLHVNHDWFSSRNWNTPGDGKFDQNFLPSSLEIAVGRVDLANMPAMAQSESVLLSNYLEKNHRFRQRGKVYGRRTTKEAGNLFPRPYPAAASVLSAFFGAGSIEGYGIFSESPYLWANAGGQGGTICAGSVGVSCQFMPCRLPSPPSQFVPRAQGVFAHLYGSWFVDWGNPDSFLLAPLCNDDFLATFWSYDFPERIYPTPVDGPVFHYMALGEAIGLCAQRGVNMWINDPQAASGANVATFQVMGDPTLRMHVVAPPSGVEAVKQANGTVNVTWQPSAETPPDLQGYYVYRASNRRGPYQVLNAPILTNSSTRYTDSSASSVSNLYMVRAVKLEQSPCGTYFNNSAGSLNALRLKSPVLGASSISFQIRGPYGLTCNVYTSTNLVTWRAATEGAGGGILLLSDGTGNFVFPNVASPTRFFRVSAPGPEFSENIIGYVRKTIGTGLTLISNPLDAADNTISALFPQLPLSSQFKKWNGTGWDIAAFLPNGWDHPGYTLAPGEAAFVGTDSPATLTFVGEVAQGKLSLSIPAGRSFRGSLVPQAGDLSGLGLGDALSNSDNVSVWNTSTQQYDVYTLSTALVVDCVTTGCGPAPTWSPSSPVLSIGDGIAIQARAPTSWERVFRGWP